MATQLVPVMPVRIDPNPRGSATSHVTMPSANPFEREAISVRTANQPGGSMPGMGDGGIFDSTFAAASKPLESSGGGFNWGGLFSDITSSVIDVGATAYKSELEKKRAEDLLKAQQANQLQSTMAQVIAGQAAQPAPTPTIQQLPVGYPSAAPPSSMSKAIPWVIGGVAVLAVGGLLFMKGGGKGRRRRR